MTRESDIASDPQPDQPQQADNVAVNDRIAARGADYAHDNNPSAEGNDPALITGPTFVRRVKADGTVEAASPDADRQASDDNSDAAPD
ncbi:hypothetical protein MNO14_11015 [Luteimonas sp. S4-F44]|uniref:hypothetical protein n=1 Tax=Luteimonas sp. S4-F44 TaxID=2925842 RepID=UPI001F532F50|nr:hypothetical protein [Luteimonas sp. S4-F44]UNK41500.1 hypothetical protein MNO14_11015 [Luteimonas sp. S4-F44]